MPELLTLKQATKNSIKIVNEISQPLKEQSGLNHPALEVQGIVCD